MLPCLTLLTRLGTAFTRRRPIQEDDMRGTILLRVLTFLDLLMLGLGSTLGLGAYLLAGQQAYRNAGPAVVLSFIFAAVASVCAGFCYAEFAARVPRAGSAYVYSYVTVGELAAFVIGWDLIMEYSIGAASLARALSDYIDNLANHAMSDSVRKVMPINISFLAKYPDFLAFSILIFGAMLVAWGVKESLLVNKVMTSINLLTVASVIIIGSYHIRDFKNWTLRKDEVLKMRKEDQDHHGKLYDPGEGGFMPFGVSGVMAASAKCFYGFVGFDGVATTGEEAKNPKRDIPLAIVIAILIILFVYISMACVLTLVVPYYDMDTKAPIAHMFKVLELTEYVRFIISAGVICALCTNIIGCMFPMPRILYSMASDKLVFGQLAQIHSYTHTPLLANVLGGLISATMSLIFDVHQLIDMMSIGTLMAYSIVAMCVLKIRYQSPDDQQPKAEASPPSGIKSDVETETQAQTRRFKPLRCFKEVLNIPKTKVPNTSTEYVVNRVLAVYVVLAIFFSLFLVNLEDYLVKRALWVICTVAVVSLGLVIGLVFIFRQPKRETKLFFKVPLLPFIPGLSILMNFYLMAKLDAMTWIRFIAWLFVGGLIYFCYGISHSTAAIKRKQDEEHKTSPQQSE